VKKTILTSLFLVITVIVYSQVVNIVDKDTSNSFSMIHHPLKGTPFIERIIPGVSFQIYSQGHFLFDVNPVLTYRITPRFSAGAGWVERWAFDQMRVDNERVYGPRMIFQFNWKKAFSLRLQPEVLNRYLPPQLISNSNDVVRLWTPSVFVGIKKDFAVYKMIRGNIEVMYNLHNPQSRSPYQDRMAIRFGFEFPMKKMRRRSG